MKASLKTLLLLLSLALFSGCAATIPVKVATKTAKAGAKTTKAAVKTTAKAGAALIPNKPDDRRESEER